MNRFFITPVFLILFSQLVFSQTRHELNSGWFCKNVKEINAGGETISAVDYPIREWMPATVPGTVLTTLLNNKKVPDPFYGMNNKHIPDIYDTGNETYTYWFAKDFSEKVVAGEQVWLVFRGINYKADFFLNGKRLNTVIHEGMHLRAKFNITSFLKRDGNNRLAIIVYPPDHPGNPNGGQGGDGTIAKDLTQQYAAGWDWIQPIRDRNTGIWDKVVLEKTKDIDLKNPHIITLVPGKRLPGKPQQPARLKVSAEIYNPGRTTISGWLQYQLGGQKVQAEVKIQSKETRLVQLPDLVVKNPKLWWPNGYGEQTLYSLPISFKNASGLTLDADTVSFGFRQIDNVWNNHTGSMQTYVNGQPIFIKGGNWIISDAMLRFSDERYNAEVRFHRDMNLNLIRIWGGAITERPEFYKACDQYGLLVFQDFWFSGDCNGRWLDPMKKEDQWARRRYPDNHNLVLTAAADQIKMIRNHPSLAFWCGGNEITPPDDILHPLKDSILPALDGTRYFFDYSNSDSMSYNTVGGNGDGPYNIQWPRTFWENKTFPYNSEVGSVGVGDYASLQSFIPPVNLVAPQYHTKPDSVWQYHKYIGYDKQVDTYGKAVSAEDFAMKAQLVNYDQYRALMEGFSAHMWDWYTGSIIWKTQNPWTALRGQMYDYYLDVNACLYGLRSGSEPLHVMMSPVDSMVMIVNNGFSICRNLMLEAKVYDILTGKDTLYSMVFNEIGPSSVKKYFSMSGFLQSLKKTDGAFVSLRLFTEQKRMLSDNFYWLPGTTGQHTALQQMPALKPEIKVQKTGPHTLEVSLLNEKNRPVAFFNRVALVDSHTGVRVLPAFFSDNYVSILPGEEKKIKVECSLSNGFENKSIEVYGWNVPTQRVVIH